MEPRDPQTTKREINSRADYCDRVLTHNEKGAVVGRLTRECGGTEGRYALLGWLFDLKPPISSHKLNEGQWFALFDWLAFFKVDGEWLIAANAQVEIGTIMKELRRKPSD